MLYVDSKTRFRDVIDGLSNTLLVGERPPSADYWYGWWYAGRATIEDGAMDCTMGVNELNRTPIPLSFLDSCAVGPHLFRRGTRDNQCDVLHYWSHHPNGASFATVDGSVHWLSYSIDNDVLVGLSTRNGNEPIPVF